MSNHFNRREVLSNCEISDTYHPVLKRIYAARQVSSDRDLDYRLENLYSYTQLNNVNTAAKIIADVITTKEQIMIVADYDADGATACALAIRCMKEMGATNIDYFVPDRFKHGYGLSTDVVSQVSESKPDLVITVDNGISSNDGVELAIKKGLKVIITDHHLAPDALPDATAIVNPNQPGDKFPSKNLAGVGVMFYVLAALRVELRGRNWFERNGLNEPNLANYLDLVAVGTVADVVTLDHNNRILVSAGVERIRKKKCVPGILHLLKIANRNPETISSIDLAFTVGPRINAAGRLTDMKTGIECLLSDDNARAESLAKSLNRINDERKMIQAEMEQEALEEISKLTVFESEIPAGICLYQGGWHQGVVGILAAKIKEKYHRPVVAFAPDSDGLIKGSGRSINTIHMRDIIDNIAVEYPGLIIKFGGHAMAAGLSVRQTDFEIFSNAFNEKVTRAMDDGHYNLVPYSDGSLEDENFTREFAEMIKDSGPWGQGFPEPLFDGRFRLMSYRIIGDRHIKMVLGTTGSNRVSAIAFNQTDGDWENIPGEIDILYRLDINEYMQKRSLQLVVENLYPVS